MPMQGAGTFPVELVLPKVPAVDDRVLQRAATVPYPDRPAGIKVVTPEDYVLFKVISFRERDKVDVSDVLRLRHDFDVGYVALSLSLILEPDDERVLWFDAAV